MSTNLLLEIELLPEEQTLLLIYGYPFAPEKEQLHQMQATGGIGVLKIKQTYLSRLIADLCYSINKKTRGRIQDELAALCDRLEYM